MAQLKRFRTLVRSRSFPEKFLKLDDQLQKKMLEPFNKFANLESKSSALRTIFPTPTKVVELGSPKLLNQKTYFQYDEPCNIIFKPYDGGYRDVEAKYEGKVNFSFFGMQGFLFQKYTSRICKTGQEGIDHLTIQMKITNLRGHDFQLIDVEQSQGHWPAFDQPLQLSDPENDEIGHFHFYICELGVDEHIASELVQGLMYCLLEKSFEGSGIASDACYSYYSVLKTKGIEYFKFKDNDM